ATAGLDPGEDGGTVAVGFDGTATVPVGVPGTQRRPGVHLSQGGHDVGTGHGCVGAPGVDLGDGEQCAVAELYGLPFGDRAGVRGVDALPCADFVGGHVVVEAEDLLGDGDRGILAGPGGAHERPEGVQRGDAADDGWQDHVRSYAS